MIVNESILEIEFTSFVNFIQLISGDRFEAFATSNFLNNEENYKYKVHEEANDNLDKKLWKSEDIGTGKIQKRMASAIKARVNHNLGMIDNNLINWRQKDEFSKKTNSEKLETTLFNFYKSKIKDSDAFEQFRSEDLSYQFIAYIFFIKDSQKFLPISQEKFDEIFKQIGLPEFKTSRNCSWENYSEFCSIIKQVQKFLKTKDKNTTLLDAHSFLWILGNQMQENKQLSIDTSNKTKTVKEKLVDNAPLPNVTESVEALQKAGLVGDDKEAADGLEQIELTERARYSDEPTDIENVSNITNTLTEKNREIYTQARIGQGVFRQHLINHWKACSVTGCEKLDVLIASHIKPWRDCTFNEAIDMTNGLLLIPNLDSLFDKGFISFDNDGAILLSPQLSSTVADQLGVKKSMRLHHIFAQHQPYLEFHRTKIFRITL